MVFFAKVTFFEIKGYEFIDIKDNVNFTYGMFKTACNIRKKKQGEDYKIIIEYGPFENEKTAKLEGENLVRNIKISMAKKRIPINISGFGGILDSKSYYISEGGLTEHGISIMEDALKREGINKKIKVEEVGLKIYGVDKNLSEIYFISQGVSVRRTLELSFENNNYIVWNEKLDVALSLLSTSHLVNDIRMKFLLKIMSIESLVSVKEYKDEAYVNEIKDILKYINSKEIDDNLKNSLKNSIGELKKRTIGEKCRDLVKIHCCNKLYNNSSAIDLFNESYKLRSKLVHSGDIDINKIYELNLYINDMVIDILLGYQSNLDDLKHKD